MTKECEPCSFVDSVKPGLRTELEHKRGMLARVLHGGEISVGLTTGDIFIEMLTDAGGRLYRNPHQLPDQRPENERAPLYVDLSMDVAVYAVDPKGNAVLTQTVLGVQAAGTAVGSDGVLAIETVASMGTWPRSGTPASAANVAPPPVPKRA